MILVDSNILLRLAQPDHPHREPAWDAIVMLRVRDGEHFAIAPQNLYEVYVVCTRPPSANGLGMTPEEARTELANARAMFHFLSETAQVYPTWEGLVAKYGIRGKHAHDARLVAMLIEHKVPRLLTFNDADFKEFTEIVTLNPFDVLGTPRIA